MSLRLRYIIYSFLLHGIIGFFLYRIFEERPLIFIGSEALLLISFFITIWFFEKMMQPTRIIAAGTDALADKDFTIKFIDQGAVEVDRLINLYNRMIDELRMERLRTVEKSQFLNKMIEASPVGIIILDFDKCIETVNEHAKRLCEITDNDIGKNISVLNGPLIKVINGIPDNSSELITIDGLQKYKCQVISIIHQGFPRKFIIIEELTAEILKTEKEAYGKVIRMMAHEVNNGTGAINSILNTIIDYSLRDETNNETRSALKVAIQRNEALNKFIENFAEILRLPAPNKNRLNLNEFIKSVVLPWQAVAKTHNIDLKLIREAHPFYINFDPNQLDRVVSNALKNAIESITKNGKITITTNLEHKTLIIADDGPGINPEIADKLFTPFFSTKTQGQGIGLMLSREILQNHNAKLSLKTNPKTGLTEFKIAF